METTTTPEVHPCEQCDFIGPLDEYEQQAYDLHRAWHELGRAAAIAFAPIAAAFREISRIAHETAAKNRALTATEPEQKDDTTP